MIFLLIGAIFVMIDFNITSVYPHIIGVFPDFIGYILLLIGMIKMHRESVKFKKPVLMAAVMIIISLLEYILNAIGILRELWGLPTVLFSIVGNILPMVIIYLIIDALKDIESERVCDLKTKRMYKFYAVWAVCTAVNVVFYLASPGDTASMQGDISSIAQWISIAAAVGFAVIMFLAARTYNALPPKEQPLPEPEPENIKHSWRDQL